MAGLMSPSNTQHGTNNSDCTPHRFHFNWYTSLLFAPESTCCPDLAPFWDRFFKMTIKRFSDSLGKKDRGGFATSITTSLTAYQRTGTGFLMAAPGLDTALFRPDY